jgi:Zn-finger nucleic acid-binding protein
MKCPTCPETNLVLSERQGIEIDYCPACRGVWLDRGELDKIIERASATQESYRPEPYREVPPVVQQRPPQQMGSHKYHSKCRPVSSSRHWDIDDQPLGRSLRARATSK